MWKGHSSPRGPANFSAISSIGRLYTVENYFIYLLVLFWDIFEAANGKSASADGIYMFCQNFPFERRRSSNAVRIISFVLPAQKVAFFEKV